MWDSTWCDSALPFNETGSVYLRFIGVHLITGARKEMLCVFDDRCYVPLITSSLPQLLAGETAEDRGGVWPGGSGHPDVSSLVNKTHLMA